jgi:hypothetical protein
MALIAIAQTREQPAFHKRSGDPILLSVVLRETHTHTAEITDYVIERGSPVSDHRRIGLPVVSIEAMCSDAIIESSAQIDDEGNVTQDPTNPRGYSWDEQYARILELFEGDEVFTVVTTARVYESMHFSSFVVTKDPLTEDVLSFSAELRRMEFADADVVAVAPAPKEKSKAPPKTDKGAKGTKEAPAKVKQDANTAAFDVAGWLPGKVQNLFTPASGVSP